MQDRGSAGRKMTNIAIKTVCKETSFMSAPGSESSGDAPVLFKRSSP